MTYSESADEITISHERAMQELDRHGVLDEAEEFHRDCGQLPTYPATEVLSWLGY